MRESGGSSEADVALLQLVVLVGQEAAPELVAQGFVELLARTRPDRWTDVAGLAAAWLRWGATPALTSGLLELRHGRPAERAREPAIGLAEAASSERARATWQRRLLAWKTGGSTASLTVLVEELVGGSSEAIRAQVATSPEQPPHGSAPTPLHWRFATPGGQVTLDTPSVRAILWDADVIPGPFGAVVTQDGRALPVVVGTSGPVAVLGDQGGERRVWLTRSVEVEPAGSGEP